MQRLRSRLWRKLTGVSAPRLVRRRRLSAYLCIFNDWEILLPALRSAAPFIDELIVVDGAYRWMTPYLDGMGIDPRRSAAPVYDCLREAGIPYQVLSGIWADEREKRKAGYMACAHRYRFRVDADEVFFFDEAALERFARSGAAVAEMACLLYVCPGWVLNDNLENWERPPFFFDSERISADDHLRELWIVDGTRRSKAARPPVFPEPLATVAHLTHWRTPATSVGRAAFYTLNWVRHNGAPWYPELAGNPLPKLGQLFERIAADLYTDTLMTHEIVVGHTPASDRFLMRSPLSTEQEERFAPLYAAFLESQAEANRLLATVGRRVLSPPLTLDLSSPAARDAVCDGETLCLRSSEPLARATAMLHELVPGEQKPVARVLPVELDHDRLSIPLPPDAAACLRRVVSITAHTAGPDPVVGFMRG